MTERFISTRTATSTSPQRDAPTTAGSRRPHITIDLDQSQALVLTFNDLLTLQGVGPAQVRLVRHQDRRLRAGRLYEAWRNERAVFGAYQSAQVRDVFPVDAVLASFIPHLVWQCGDRDCSRGDEVRSTQEVISRHRPGHLIGAGAPGQVPGPVPQHQCAHTHDCSHFQQRSTRPCSMLLHAPIPSAQPASGILHRRECRHWAIPIRGDVRHSGAERIAG